MAAGALYQQYTFPTVSTTDKLYFENRNQSENAGIIEDDGSFGALKHKKL